jgi:lipoprotein YgeR
MAASQAANVGSIPITRSRFIQVKLVVWNAQGILSAGFAIAFMCVTGCVTVEKALVTGKPVTQDQPGALYHKVMRGETLWRIARMYGTDVDRIAQANNIQDATQLETGSRLLIPGGSPKEPSVTGVQGEDFIWPVSGAVVCAFGQPYKGVINKGLIISPGANVEVKASRSGTVVFYNDDFLNFGKTLIVDHGDGFMTVYAGFNNVSVKPGDIIQRGSEIAQAAGHNIHFEIRKGVQSQNPAFYLSK